MLDFLKKMRKNMIEKKEMEKLEIKQSVGSLIVREWSEDEVYNYNCNLLINSAGWLGGDYTEKDIKFILLNQNRKYFSDEEYEEYRRIIESKGKIKRK